MPGTPSGVNHSSDSQKCGRNADAAFGQLLVQLGEPLLEDAAFDVQVEVGHPQVEQLLVRPLRPVRRLAPRAPGPRGSIGGQALACVVGRGGSGGG